MNNSFLYVYSLRLIKAWAKSVIWPPAESVEFACNPRVPIATKHFLSCLPVQLRGSVSAILECRAKIFLFTLGIVLFHFDHEKPWKEGEIV